MLMFLENGEEGGVMEYTYIIIGIEIRARDKGMIMKIFIC